MAQGAPRETRPATRAKRRSTFTKLACLTAVTLTAALLAACGGGEGQPSDNAAATSPTAPSSQGRSPAALGETIGALYVDALTDLVALIERRPSAAEVETQIETLKESYVLRLVELGEARERLGADERSVVDAQVRASINAVPPDVFSAYSDGLEYYRREGEAEVAELIADFNIITQYADFELLKEQEPLEAERLGLD